eukprot:15458332-Alexandrium_andersonii.AAC.1
MPTSMKTYTLLSRRMCPSQGCAPSCGAACAALVPPRRTGRHCIPRRWRASGLPGEKRVRAASTTR